MNATEQSQHPRHLLIVDDDADVLKATSRLLTRAGFTVDAVASGDRALQLVAERAYSAILSDINMPGMDGLELLRKVREENLDTPVILLTGGATVDSAIRALNSGAFRYLLKPVAPDELIETVTRAVLLSDLARLKREAFVLQGNAVLPVDDREALNRTFERALERMFMVFHPIFSMRERRAIGYEALVRSHEPTLANPMALLDTAGLLGRHEDLTRAIYTGIAARAEHMPDGRLLFVNVHPPDLLDPSLHGTGSPLAPYADRIVLEITERASIERMGDITNVVRDLRLLKYRLAVDDLGQGYAGLSSFTQLSPDVVKIDRSLVTGIHSNPVKQRVVGAMNLLCSDLGMQVVSEGVETKAERDALVDLGANLLQGYLFGSPSPEFTEPTL